MKLLYDTIKKKVRKDRAEEKMQLYKTGGGSEFKSKIDPIGDKFLEITNNITEIELLNPFDSSSVLDKIVDKGQENSSSNDIDFVIINSVPLNIEENAQSSIITNKISSAIPTEKKKSIMKPNSPYFHGSDKRAKNLESVKLESEKVKLDILKIRREKEEIEKDILKLQKREKELELKQRYPFEEF